MILIKTKTKKKKYQVLSSLNSDGEFDDFGIHEF